MKPQGRLIALAMAGAVLGFVLPAAAVPLAYDEAVSGDIGEGAAPPFTAGTLDIGANTVSGSLSGVCTPTGTPPRCDFPDMDGDRRDRFRVILPDTLMLDSVVLQISNYTVAGASIHRGFYNSSIGAFGPFSADVTFPDLLPGPITSNPTWTIDADRLRAVSVPTATLDFDYVYTFDVSAIPAPATLPLLLGAFGLFALRRRR